MMAMFSVDGCISLCTNEFSVLGIDDCDGSGVDNGFKIDLNDINGVGMNYW